MTERQYLTPSASEASYGQGISQALRHKVLRNTLWLLAISMVPTVLGAVVGLKTGLAMALTGGAGLVVFLVGAFGFMWAIEKNKNSGVGVALLLAFTFFMGIMLSRLLGFVLGFSNGASLIITAFSGTAAVFFVMAVMATMVKRDLSGMGTWLFAGMLVVFFGSLINFFVGSSIMMLVISVAAIAIFSAYMLYDIKRVLDGGETNYISATLALYLDVYIVFQNLLALLGIFGGSSD